MTAASITQNETPRLAFALFAVPVANYDFKAGVARVETAGEPVTLPLTNFVTFCASDAPGTQVLVDDTISGVLLLATEEWAIVTPAGQTKPVVVESRRVARLPGARKLAA